MRLNGDDNDNEIRYIMAKFKNKFRIESIRLPGYDYSQSGAYFITVVTKNREHFFGEIVNGKMELSEIGEIVKNEWQKTAEIREYVQLGEWVIMPNHFHAIVIIQNDNKNVETHSNASLRCNASLRQQNDNQQYQNKFGPQSQNLSSIIRGFKGATKKQIRTFYPYFAWQSRFYEHVIRNENEFQKISEYIMNNPINWEDDENNIKM